MEDLIFSELRGTGMLALLLKFTLAVLCGGLIGLERGAKRQAAGFRTHILVCAGACIAAVTGQYIHLYLAPNADPARLGAQVISGIGFLGVGTIVSTKFNKVRGLTTAAGLWAAACIGLAIGIGFFEAAAGGTLLVFLAIVVFQRVDEVFYARSPILNAYVEMDCMEHVTELLATLRSSGMKISAVEVQKPKSGLQNRIGISLTVRKLNRKDNVDILDVISSTDGLTFIEETY